jgi:protein TonB
MIVLDYDSSMLPTTSSIAALPVGSSPTLPRFEPASAAATKPEGAPVSAGPVSVGGDVQAAKLLKRVIPLYPKTAVQLRISGIVHLLGIIGKDGTIQKLQVLSGHPLLRQAALDAVSQWVYRPTILNGQPVEVEAPVDVVFTLSQ